LPDLLLDTISPQHDLNLYLQMLKRDDSMVLVGVPEEAPKLQVFNLIMGRKSLAGSFIECFVEMFNIDL